MQVLLSYFPPGHGPNTKTAQIWPRLLAEAMGFSSKSLKTSSMNENKH